jgi:serine/threonine-protein kinase
LIVVSGITGLGFSLFHERDYVPQVASLQTPHSNTAHENDSDQQPVILSQDSDEARQGEKPPKKRDDTVQVLIPAGGITIPENLGSEASRTVNIDSFYLDETMVTNHQYVEFLNKVRDKVKVERGMVSGEDGKLWLLLGEVKKGYEPITFVRGKFRVNSAAHAACPVLRVTAYGATAYAWFYGRRLMTEAEWFYVVSEGATPRREPSGDFSKFPEGSQLNEADAHGQDQRPASISTAQEGLPIPSPVIMSKPNHYGARGLNGNMGEWGILSVNTEKEKPEYIVLGGALSRSENGDALPSAIQRHPWEAFSEVGFRCALSIADQAM